MIGWHWRRRIGPLVEGGRDPDEVALMRAVQRVPLRTGELLRSRLGLHLLLRWATLDGMPIVIVAHLVGAHLAATYQITNGAVLGSRVRRRAHNMASPHRAVLL